MALVLQAYRPRLLIEEKPPIHLGRGGPEGEWLLWGSHRRRRRGA